MNTYRVALTQDEWATIREQADRIVKRSKTSRSGLTPEYQNTGLRKGFELGFAGELAVGKFLQLETHIHKDFDQVRHRNDVGDFEIRTRSEMWSNIGIKDYEFGKFSGAQKFILCWYCYPNITIAGYQTLSFIKNHGETRNRITYLNYRHMRDVMELIA